MNANRFDRSADMPRFIRPVILGALSALLVAALCAGCGKGGGPVAGKDPVKKVIKVENNVDALRAWAANNTRASVLVHIDPSDDMAIFPASRMKDMENAAGHLRRRNVKALDEVGPLIERGGTVSLGYMAGMYKRVIWVIPTIRPVGEDPVEVYKNFLITRRRFPPAAVADFKAEGKFITGTIAGVPLTITRLADLTLADGENAIVDIDLSYFPAMKVAGQSYYRTGTKSLLDFLRELGKRNVKSENSHGESLEPEQSGSDGPQVLRRRDPGSARETGRSRSSGTGEVAGHDPGGGFSRREALRIRRGHL